MKQGIARATGLFLFALIWVALALWSKDVRGAYIALFCLLLIPVQIVRSAKASR